MIHMNQHVIIGQQLRKLFDFMIIKNKTRKINVLYLSVQSGITVSLSLRWPEL